MVRKARKEGSMTLPKPDYRGRETEISMMELRSTPGEVVDCVKNGMTIHLEKNGKRIATLIPSEQNGDTTTIHSDGSISGPIPLTFRRNLGNGGY